MDTANLNAILFAGSIGLILLLEWLTPWQRRPPRIRQRWLTNLGLMFAGAILVGMVIPIEPAAVARDMLDGRFRQWQLPLALEVLLVFLLLDCWRYWEHRVMHEVPLLWRLHLVHHSDTSLDITTGQRHHPLESMVATCTVLLLVFALGFSPQALAVYVAVATLSSLWTHANIDLPEGLDRPLRRWLVTPAVHAVHHSDYQPQTDSNYGSVLSLWDRLFGTYSDPAVARVPNFGLEYFHSPADTALAPVLLQPFEYRSGMSYPARESDVPDPVAARHTALSPAWRKALWQITVSLALALFALWPTAVGLAQLWTRSEPYQYAWLVLPMFIYAVGWFHRDRILAMTPRPDALGLPVIVLAVVGWSAARVVDIQLGQQLALVLVLQGIALCTLGRTVYRHLFPLMAMLFLMVPCGDILQPLLRELTVRWIEWFTLAFDLPHRVEGFMVYVGEHRYVVIDACSGLTFVTLAGFLGYSFGVLLFRSFTRILALAAVGAALGIFSNALRVWLIVGIDWLQGSQLDMAAHMDLQWLALAAALGLLFYLTAQLAERTSTDTVWWAPSASPGWRAARFAPVLAAGLVVLIALPVQHLGTTAPTGQRSPLAEVAAAHPGSHWLEDATSTAPALLIPYGPHFEAVIAESSQGRDKVDPAQLGPPKDIWRHTQTGRYDDCNGDQCTRFVHNTWRRKGSTEARHAFHVFFAGDTVTDSKLSYRLARGWSRLAGTATTPSGLIGFRVRGDLPPPQTLVSALHRLTGELAGASAPLIASASPH